MDEKDPEPTPFDQVVDDDTPREESRVWAIDQLRDGRSFDDVLADLIESGWDAESAEQILEKARKFTRPERGVVTREQVAKAANAYHRSGSGNGMLAGLPTIAAIRRLLYSFATLKFLRSKMRK